MRRGIHFPSKEAMLLYLVFTFIFAFLFGVLPSYFGLYPSSVSSGIKSDAPAFMSFLGVLVAVFSLEIVQKSWQKVQIVRVVLVSGVTIILVGLFFMLFSHITATAKANSLAKATATAQAAAAATTMEIAQLNATSTVIASHYPFSRTFLLRDLLERTRSPNFWDTTPNANGGCQYQGFAYRVSTLQGAHMQICFAEGTEYFTNFTYEIQMRIIQGDCGGIAFRANDMNSNFYVFKICQDGSFDFGTSVNGIYKEIPSGYSSNILRGHYGINTIAVVARKCEFQFYINNSDRLAYKTSECSYNAGHIGVFAYSNGGKQPTRVFFAHAKVWKL